MNIPVIDVSPLRAAGSANATAEQIRRACTKFGFFYVVGHGVDQQLCSRLEQLSRRFFAQDLDTKLELRMERGGRAWRGYFPVGAELTQGQPDQKEGLYFGAELSDVHPLVLAKTPLHGRNLFPSIAEFRETVLEYLDALTALGHVLMEGIALSLSLERSYFAQRYTRDPLVLFRIFHYPPLPAASAHDSQHPLWSVGEHTDYGLLTILLQDHNGGLQIKSQSRWIEAPPIPGSFVCNLGDMLDRMTGGVYRSTPHRVRNQGRMGRLSFPFFFDPNFHAQVRPLLSGQTVDDDKEQRWDQSSVHLFQGVYGDYLLTKVAKVFPQLFQTVGDES